MNYFKTQLIVIIIAGSLFSCGEKKAVTESRSGKESGEVEPDQLRPEVDTRFQEKFFQAQLEKSKGNTKEAYDLFSDCLKIEPQSAVTLYEMARIELQTFNNAKMAMERAKQAVELDRNNPWYQMILGESCQAMAKYDLAIKSYREVLRLNPGDPNVLFLIANTQLMAGKISDAIATYDLLEKESGPYEELTLQKHQLYLQIKEPEKAGLELEKLAMAFPDEAKYWGMTAQFYQKIGLDEKANAALQQMVKADPENGQVHFQLSEYYAGKGDDENSYKELKLAFGTVDVGIDQKISVLLRYLSLTDVKPEYLTQAYELLELTEQMHPSEAKAYSIYGDFLYRDGKRAEALLKYKKAASLDLTKNLIWEQILVIESEMGDFESMANDSKQALELFPNLPEFYYYDGMANQRLKRYERASSSFALGKELVIENDELLGRFYSSLGEVYHYQGLHDKSDEAYEEAIRIDPNNVFILNNYAYYLSLRKVKLERAESMSKMSNELSPGMSSFEDTYAWILFQLGKYEDALKWINKALSHDESNGELLEHQGDILFKLGRVDDAVSKWKLANQAGGAGSKIQRKIVERKFIEDN